MEKRENKGSEDKALDRNPNDIHFQHPAKKEQANENENISEWHQKNDISQTLYQENSDPTISQIDKGTVALQEEKLEKKPSALDREDNESENTKEENNLGKSMPEKETAIEKTLNPEESKSENNSIH